jgi:cytochrome c oxidase assembly protein subunit 15
MKAYRTFLVVTLLLAFCVIVLGAYTRLSDAGLGCPDWPTCYGHLTVPDSPEAVEQQHYLDQRPLDPAKGWAEMIHRYFAGMLGLFILVLAVWSWRLRRRHPDHPLVLPLMLLGVVVFQSLLGMWTVTLLLKPLVVMGHLLGGFATLGLLFLLLRITGKALAFGPRGRVWAAIALLVLVIQVALGGWTSTNYAALSCTDFPTCQGGWWSEMDFSEAFIMWRGLGINYEYGVLEHPARIAIHVTHRLGALTTLLVVGGFALYLLVRGGPARRAGIPMLSLLVLQIGLGIGNVLLHLPLPVAVAHNAVAALLLLSLINASDLLWRRHY